MRRAGDGVNHNGRGRDLCDVARAGARSSSSWIRALANAWEDDWTRAQGAPDEKPAVPGERPGTSERELSTAEANEGPETHDPAGGPRPAQRSQRV
jgi:hypothetical protein